MTTARTIATCLLFCIAGLEAGCRHLPAGEKGAKSREASFRRARPAVLFEMLRDTPEPMLILDVRTAEEFTGSLGHVRNAVNIPLAELPFRLAELDAQRSRTFLVYCRNDDCGRDAMATLVPAGFTGATLLDGGIEAWVEDGFGTVEVTAPDRPALAERLEPPSIAAALEAMPPGNGEGVAVNAVVAASPPAPRPGEAYLRLLDGSLILPPRRPHGLHVRGRMAGGRFMPIANVEGQGETCAEWRDSAGIASLPAWMELNDGMVYPDTTARTPVRPFVKGCVDAEGLFRPDGRDIVN